MNLLHSIDFLKWLDEQLGLEVNSNYCFDRVATLDAQIAIKKILILTITAENARINKIRSCETGDDIR